MVIDQDWYINDAYFLFVNDRCYSTIGNQAFSHKICNMFPGLSSHMANNTILNSLGKNDFDAQVEFTFKVMESARVMLLTYQLRKTVC